MADAKEALKALLKQDFEAPDTTEWLDYLKSKSKDEYPLLV